MLRRVLCSTALRASARLAPRCVRPTCVPTMLHRACSSMTPPSDGPKMSSILSAPGMESEGDKFVMLYTCTVCDTRAAKTISKQAYYNGVVLVRCPKCENLHLIADRLGWFEDDSYDVEGVLKAKGSQAKIVTGDDILELTEADILGSGAKILVDDDEPPSTPSS
ncbi:hypothetical protein SDRG_01753 [Saprolegnia diclina VS20]|uniref:DNL-type domain-containing protein n=1 Tax=Saprolegnia diclina (strain VS20) TaxID=1156394 RepID=T0R2W8_SAPDV|nr:hypothetical protein SDRG_01753 [Saprolegnia diclina VS20]EQC40675.1 hypothetical protein SDRG_01753 [Saprolegnia diclina VS20]|eukprot:XP_008605519.1 hypothetical protein SDRG_01753 [Saprolegnia diclina VS20]